jgi:hypothetical protein
MIKHLHTHLLAIESRGISIAVLRSAAFIWAIYKHTKPIRTRVLGPGPSTNTSW